MNKIDYNALMLKTAEENRGKSLLLHCCCAPCSSACLERLKDYFKITVLFYNPNISGEEYLLRKAELKKLIDSTHWADLLDCDREEEKFQQMALGHENDREGGERCKKCFSLRLQKTAELANCGKFDFFTTTLTISPLKNAALINSIGESLTSSAKWLPSDFKKSNGYLRSLELSKEFELYRQNYCGCEFSKPKTP